MDPITRMRRWSAGVVLALAVVGFGREGAQAQPVPDPGASSLERAAWYEAEAARLSLSRDDYPTAIKYFELAAGLRPEGDGQALRDIVRAGQLSYYLGDSDRAQASFLQVGETALQYGDVATAADAFLDAAWIAEREGRVRVAAYLADRVRKLAQSPLLKEEGRHAILKRMTSTSAPGSVRRPVGSL